MSNRIAIRPHGRIRQARQKSGLPQTGLADQLGVHRSAVSQWESPHGSLPTLENLIALARFTGVHFEWLATGRGPMAFTPDDSDVLPLHADSYAHDYYEERLLKDYRLLPATARKALIDFLEAIKRKK